MVPKSSSNVSEPAARYDAGMRLAMVKSGGCTGLTRVWNAVLVMRTRSPATPLVTFVVRSRIRIGFSPAASRTLIRDWLTRFWPAERMRNWIA